MMPGPAKWDSSRMMDEGKLRSESIFREDRRYYLDLKENHRGRFLRVYTLYLAYTYIASCFSSNDNILLSTGCFLYILM